MIGTDFLKPLTEKVRSRKASKSKVLPYVTPCGTFKRRNVDEMLTFSGIVVIDIDCCDVSLKRDLALDPFLQPVLVFISPSSMGLKLFIRVKNACVENHQAYFNAICWYILKVHQVVADKSGSDLPRACFLCHDPEVYYHAEGSVSSEALLEIVPQIPAEKSYRHGNKVDFRAVHNTPLHSNHASGRDAINRVCTPTVAPRVSTATSEPVFSKPTTTDEPRPSDLLNRLPQIHERAVAALKADGWVQINDDLWRRPGKNGGSHSAIYNYFDCEGIYFFTNYSSNSQRFGLKGYTDTMLICELEFPGDWNKCITQLAHEYL